LDAAKASLRRRGKSVSKISSGGYENGYLNLRFWFDGGAIALLPKIAMVLGSYLLAWFCGFTSRSAGLGL